ncbi:DUF6364 family protein [Leptospira kanakyensis]|uniref:Antitoxin n=1 Tax=Leptospira kanakyensis TaxID=2484968 RepID=A0A6N4Q4Y1_9LEPT|nr:DUF6364 family protein [Leptospira kanakyensis]MCW7470114.1 DUF6364 family protein [Leptospira kanakyensis]TGK47875.1 antitoxin [Leptospira kanakyensis]TGK63117.1 antitoxin [Leptospira kanakyensis]TGK66723.1 antitoxin [Leptospira kanakyensis]
MNTKLTLSIDDKIIKHAKEFAKQRNKSLSRLVEDYLDGLSSNNDPLKAKDIPPITRKLAGVLKGNPDVDIRKEIASHLENKYK